MKITAKNYVLVNILTYSVTILLLCSYNVTCRGISLPEIARISFRRQDSKDITQNDDRQPMFNTQSTEDEPGETSCKDCQIMQRQPTEKTKRQRSVLHSKRKQKRKKKKRTKRPDSSNIQIENLKIGKGTNISLSQKSDLNHEYRNENTKIRTAAEFRNTNAEMLSKDFRAKHSKNMVSKKTVDFRFHSHGDVQQRNRKSGKDEVIQNTSSQIHDLQNGTNINGINKVRRIKKRQRKENSKPLSKTELKNDQFRDKTENVSDKSKRKRKHFLFHKNNKTNSSSNLGKAWLHDYTAEGRRRKGTRKQQSDFQGKSPSLDLQVPPGVSRIERRLRPSIHAFGAEILSSLQRMMRQVQYGVQTLHMDYEYMFNSTRYNMMLGVREELKEISTESDKVYNVVLKMSKMVRTMHQRAQKHEQIPPPQELRKPPELLSIDFRNTVHDVENNRMKANRMKRNVQNMNVQCQQLKAQSMEFDSRLKDRLPDVQLVDLVFFANRTLHQLTDISIGDTVKLKVQRYKNMDMVLMADLSNATGYYKWAHKNLVSAVEIHQLNVAHHDQIIKSHNRRSATLTQPAADVDPSVRAALEDIVSKASSHANDLDEIFHIIKGRISPVLQSARVLLNITGNSALQLHLGTMKQFLKNFLKDINHVLDKIRVVLGDQHEIKIRCEEIVEQREGSGFIEDVESPIECEDYIEGSGADVEIGPSVEIKSVVTPSPVEDTGTDFFFGLFDDDPMAEMSTFGEKLEEFASNLHSKSEKKFQTSVKIKDKTTDISQQWGTTMSRIKTMTKNSHEITGFLNSWEQSQFHMNNVSNRISGMMEHIYFKSNLTQTKAVHAGRTIARLKQTIEAGGKNEKASNDQPDVDDMVALSSVVEVVGKVKGKVNSIMTLKRVFQDPCQKLRNQAAWLRSNITELKRKIEKASLAASSLKMSVSLSGRGYIHIPLHHEASLSLTTSISLFVKPAGGDALLAVVQGSDRATFAMVVENEKLVLTVYGKDGETLHRLDGSSSMESEKWYRIRINRYGQRLTLAVGPLAATPEEEESSKEIIISEIEPLQLMPNLLYLGGVPESLQDVYGEGWWAGCVGNVAIDSHYIGLLRNDSSGHFPEPCEKCPGLDNMSIVMEGGGYVKFPLSILDQSLPIDNINLVFQTNQHGGLLFLLNDKRQHVQLLISLIDGGLLLEARILRGTFGGTTVTKSTNRLYSDGNLHEINVRLLSDRIKISTDDGEDPFVQETSTQEIPTHIQDGIFLGGINGLVHSSSDDKFKPLRGCVQSLKLNDQIVPLAVLEDSRNVYLGNCNEDIWSTCARFSEESLPVSLPERDKLKTLYLAITPDSRGPVLHYRKDKTLSLVIVSDDQGLEVTQVVTDKSMRLSLQAGQTQLWYFIAITDRQGEIDIESGGEKLIMEYEANSKGWFYAKALPSKVEITVGGIVDDGEVMGGFVGAISTILIDNSPVSLENNMTEHGLRSCSKPLVIKTEPKPDIKPSC